MPIPINYLENIYKHRYENKIKLFLPSRILKTIYSSLILCQLNYGILFGVRIIRGLLSLKNGSCELLHVASVMRILNRCSKN